MSTTGLKWLPIPLDLWVPAGLKDFQEGWFINLLRASLRSEYLGYLILCEEGCSGCSACLWRVANAHHPEYFRKHGSLVLACFNCAQIAGHRVLYFPKLAETVRGQLSKIRNHRPRKGGLSETSTPFNRDSGECSPSDSLFFDFELDSKNKKTELNTDPVEAPTTMSQDHHFSSSETEQCARRIVTILRLPESSLPAGIAAVEAECWNRRAEAKRSRLSIDTIVQRITTEANQAERMNGTPSDEFLEDFLARKCARRALEILNLSVADNFVSRLAFVLKAESKDVGLSLDETAKLVTQAASDARQRSEKVSIFYFENFTWRSNARTSKAEQRKLGNLAANERAKEILRERLR
jgi:hypothetical protein